MKIVVEEIDIVQIMDLIHDWLGLDYSREQILTLLDEEPALKGQIAVWGFNELEVRAEIMDTVAIRILGRACPYDTASEEKVEQFYQELYHKASEMGIAVVNS